MQIIGFVFLLAQGVIVPLALRTIARIESEEFQVFQFSSAARKLWFISLLCSLASLALDPGTAAAVFSVPWLVCCMALLVKVRCVKHRTAGVALVYLCIGAVWLIAARMGLNPLGFSNLIAHLTAVHFHYAGFFSAFYSLLVVHHITFGKRAASIFHFAVLIAPGCVAAGILLSPRLELISSGVLFVSLTGLVILLLAQLRCLPASAFSKGLLLISGISFLLAMSLAVLFAWGEYTGQVLISVPKMIVTHGILNSIGFALCGVLGWKGVVTAPSKWEIKA